MKTILNLIKVSITELPYLIKIDLPTKIELKILWEYLKISFKLIFIHRFRKITQEKLFGFSIKVFDYGTLHFLFREIFLKNTYFFKSNKTHPVFFDCGANIGMATLYFKLIYPESIIHAFEPDPITFSALENNIKKNNLKNIHLHNIALYNKKGKISFYIDKNNPGWLTMSTIKERLPKDKIEVDSGLLSEFIGNKKIDMLKIDVEGSEIFLLTDLVKSKKINLIDNMLIEYHHNINREIKLSHFIELLERTGLTYKLQTQPNALSDRNITQDILIHAIRKNRILN